MEIEIKCIILGFQPTMFRVRYQSSSGAYKLKETWRF